MYSSWKFHEAEKHFKRSIELNPNIANTHYHYAWALYLFGRHDEAFKWLEYEPHHLWIPWVAVFPMWKPIHSDPRYTEFVKRLNLPKA